MLSLFDFQHTPARLADVLPWMAIVGDNPCVVRHKDGSLQHTLRFQAPDLDAVTASEMYVNAARLNNVIKRAGTGTVLCVEYTKRRVREYLSGAWPNAASEAADMERRAYFLGTPHYTLGQTLTLVWRPRAMMEQRAWRYLTTKRQQGNAAQNDVQIFQDQARQLTNLLEPCMTWVQPLGPEGTLTHLHATISTDPHRIAVPEVPAYLDCGLSDRDFVPGMEPALIIGSKPQAPPQADRWQDQYRAHHLRTLTITGFPNATYPDMLGVLSRLPLEFRYVIRWMPLDQGDAYQVMKHHMAIWRQALTPMKQHVVRHLAKLVGGVPLDPAQSEPDREAALKKEGLDNAMDACMSGEQTFGYFTATVTVWDEDERQAQDNLNEVEKAITGRGFACHQEGLNATEAWLGSLPGECYKNVRKPLLTSMNLAHAMLSGIDTGPETDTHLNAPPVMLVDTNGTMPYHVVLHENGVGHTMILGPSGAGKTTLVGALAMQFQRYDALGARIRLVDKKGGLEPVTRAMGGDHYTLDGTGAGLAFQPLRGCVDVFERQWGAAWVESLCEQQQVPCTPTQRRELWDALTGLAALPAEHRTLTALATLVQDVGLRQALHPYTVAGAYGRVLDAVAEPLALRPWSCFETDALFSLPQLVAPVLGVLFHQLDTAFQERRPTFFVLDEAWKYLSHMTFREKIEEYLRELRKLQVSLVFSTQDIWELLESPIASVILNNCPIRFFLPNKHALEPKIMATYEQLGLNARQIELIATGMPHRDYLLQTGDGCRMVDLALGPVQLSILTKGVF